MTTSTGSDGLTKRFNPDTAAGRREVLERYGRGETAQQIAAATGWPIEWVRGVRRSVSRYELIDLQNELKARRRAFVETIFNQFARDAGARARERKE